MDVPASADPTYPLLSRFDSSRPWLGRSGVVVGRNYFFKQSRPWTRWLRREAAAPFGSVCSAYPRRPRWMRTATFDPSMRSDQDLAQAKGRTLILERAGDWGEQTPQGNPARLEHLRYGLERRRRLIHVEHGDWPRCSRRVRCATYVCSLPTPMGQRSAKAFRRFLHSEACGRLARIMEAELRIKLDAPELVLDLSPSFMRRTLPGERGRFKAFVSSGVSADDAARNAGIVLSQPVSGNGGEG